MTIQQNTTPQIVGLAACGAAAIGLSLDEALTMHPCDLRTMLAAAGLAEPAMPPAAVLPTQPRPAAPVAEERTRLIRPGMTIPAGDVDPEDESLYI